MSSLYEAKIRHAHHYAQCCEKAETWYRNGRQTEGLELFDQERIQTDAAWQWLISQKHTPELDTLILVYADATASVGEIRYQPREERIPRLEIHIAAAQRQGKQRAIGQALGNLALTLAYLGEYTQAIYS